MVSLGFTLEAIPGAVILLLASYAAGRLSSQVGVPAIVGNIGAGLLLGPSLLHLFDENVLQSMGFVNTLALALVALAIGEQLQFTAVRQQAKTIAFISIFEVSAAFGLVAGSIFLLGQPWQLAILFGAIAMATAPAGTIAVIREYRAKGPLSSTLLVVVALGNLWAIVVTDVALAMIPRASDASLLSVFGLVRPSAEIGASVALGAGLALALHYLSKVLPSRRIESRVEEQTLLLVLGIVLLGSVLADRFQLSSMLVNMTIGCLIANYSYLRRQILGSVTRIDFVVYTIFFGLAGAHIDLQLLGQMGLVGVAYILTRPLGKFAGATLGATLAGSEEPIQRYLGMGLFSQAGLAIALVVLVQQRFPEVGSVVATVVFAGVGINEIVGPLPLKLAIARAREVGRDEAGLAELQMDPMRVITVADAMTRDFPTVPETMPVAELATLFERTGHHGFPILDAQGRLSGIVALSDVQRASVEGDADLTVGDIATREVVTAFPDQSLHQALQQFGALDLGQLPVVERHDPRRLVGVLRRRDIVSAYSRSVQQRQEGQPAPGPLATLSSNHLLTVELNPACAMLGKPVAQLGLPKDCLLVAIDRNGGLIIPRGDTVLQAGDQITIVASPAARERVADMFE